MILGLGGGSIAGLIKKLWPQAKITGVDADPLIVELGKKYMDLSLLGVKIVIQDALDFLTNHESPTTNHYNLICVDLYVGDKYPEKFESDRFLKLILRFITDNGVAIFNRLYYNEKRTQAMKFGEKLRKIFPKVQTVFPEANVMFVCSE